MVGLLHGRGADGAAGITGSGGEGPLSIAVVGAKGGVGRSTLALNLAAAAAHTGEPVLLLDANRPAGDLATLIGSAAPAPLTGPAGMALLESMLPAVFAVSAVVYLGLAVYVARSSPHT